jgi:hypothetical protein
VIKLIRMLVTHERRAYLRPARHALRERRFFTAILYVLLACLSPLAERREERALSGDLYVMF